MRLIKLLFKLILFLILAGALIALGYYFAVTKNVAIAPEKLLLNEKSVIVYDVDGQKTDTLFSPAVQQTVRIADIPTHTKNAFVCVEDKRFYSHDGFDVKRIAKAALNNLKARSFKEGASTISQQLIKNTHLSQEKTLKRKLKEWKLTRALERKYTKDEILEKYLNTIYFGHNCFGINAAAKFYFSKSATDLTLGESAILAGLVKSPNNYSPFRRPEECKKRKAVVLALMQNNKKITPAQKQAALEEPLPQRRNDSHLGYAHFMFDELSALAEKLGFTVGGKVELYTYLQPDVQSHLENMDFKSLNCGKTVLVADNATGGYKACVSDVGNIRRLPGSVIKPLLVYGPAMEENFLSPATQILDEKVNYGGYQPENYDNEYHGYVSARTAIEKSLNIPAVKTLQAVGVKKCADYLRKMRFPVPEEDESLALALGGMKEGFTLRELTDGYSALANGGEYTEGGFIREIKINGQSVYRRKIKRTKIFSKETAYLLTDTLKSTAKNGTAKKLRSLPFEIAAKTGTSGTKQGNRDAYSISYTTKDCVAVWLGNADNSKIEHTGGGVPCNIAQSVHQFLYEYYGKSLSPFPQPDGVIKMALDKDAYEKEHTLMQADKLSPAEHHVYELFNKNAQPKQTSARFSCPTVRAPTTAIDEKGVRIDFGREYPDYYEYKIERKGKDGTKTLYFGQRLPSFWDETVAAENTYVYMLTPYYKGNAGVKITLPAIHVKERLSETDKKAIEKEWWKE